MKKKKEKMNIEKIKTENNISKTIEKPISVNSNNNYLIIKLKKENENLRLKLSKYTNNNKYKPIDNKIKQKKIENAVRITKKISNNKQLITKSSNNFVNFANNTYTNNFYNSKDNKFKTNNNSSVYNNINKNIYNNITMTANSFISHNKKNIKKGFVKSLSVYRYISKNKSKNKTKKIMYDKIKSNYKKIQNKLSNSNIYNYIEMKIKEKKDDDILSNLNINNLHNSRMNKLNNNMYDNNIFSWKKKIEKDKNNQNLNSASGNLYNTDRKKTETNVSNSNSKERNTTNYILNNEFNLTWSRFPKKSIEASFEHYHIGQKKKPKIILSSKNQNINNEFQINNTHNQLITKDNSKNNYFNNQIYNNINKANEVIKIRKDITPQKIKINRRIINNNKIKTNIINNGNNNISMKNIINIKQNNNKYENNTIIQEDRNINTVNNIHDGDIYVHKKRNSAFGIERKNNFNYNNNDIDLKKNNNLNDKYNVTINNINNCNYFSLIQTSIRPELKIIQKKMNKNNY